MSGNATSILGAYHSAARHSRAQKEISVKLLLKGPSGETFHDKVRCTAVQCRSSHQGRAYRCKSLEAEVLVGNFESKRACG